MGTYPFLSAALRYLEDQKPYLAETTIKERNRKFRYLNREYVRLWKEGKISTTNPKKLTEKDIGAILLWMKEKGLDPSTQRKYIGFLARVLTHGGNPVINQMKDKKLPLPRDVPKEIKTLSEEEIHHIQVSAEKLHGWHGEILRFVTTMYPYTGLRPSELRLARIEDIDTSTWTIWVRHPKGEGKYAKQRTVPIPPPARACVLQYLQARTKQLKKFGIKECEPLIPYFKAQEKQDAYFSEGNFCRLKRKLQEIAGIKFKLKDFRSSYAQMLKDKNVNIEVISKALGHSSTKTTEKYYARIRDSYVSEIINRAWENVQNPLERFPKNRKMDFENCLSGYA